MKRDDVLKDIEQKLRALGYSDEKDLEILKKYYFQLLQEGTRPNDIKISKDEQEKLSEIYKKRIENEKNKVDTENIIDSNKIKVVISTVSLANVSSNILEELPLEKTLRLCENVKNVYLFYSNEASEKFKLIKEKLNNKNIEVNSKMTDKEKLTSENIVSMRAFLFDTLKVLKEKGIKEDEILIDLTVGMKLASIAMYKIAVENGIKIVNWKEIYFSKYKKNEDEEYSLSNESFRIVFSAMFEIIKEILAENKQMLLDINASIKRKEYQTVVSLYKKLDRKNEELFFKEISELFNKDLFLELNVGKFSNKLKDFVETILAHKEFPEYFKEKIKNLMIYLQIVSDFDVKDLEDYNKEFVKELKLKYEEYKDKNSEDADVSDFLVEYYSKKMKNLGITDEDLEILTFDEELLSDIEETLEEEDEIYYLPETYSLKNLYLYLVGINIAEPLLNVKKILFTDEIKKVAKKSIYEKLFFETDLESYYEKKLFEENKEQYERIKNLISLNDLLEKVDNSLTYENSILKISKYDIVINLEKEGIKLNDFHEAVMDLLLKEEILTNDKLRSLGESITETTFNKYKSIFNKSIVAKLNEIIVRKLRENNYLKMDETEDFIKTRHQNKVSNQDWAYKINEKFI
ncbi:hypothetical protein [Fusobacterium periodonticum]|jgi:hypothetical protein|uniref:hypothetical protein n=1 Tax=Fusobacterium periodonticum TaxID=860 RepID=UPI0019592FF4|nr:hypothetical protein [Fusobacterium periodonticum]VTX93319.1 Uncharacterised protein [Fusobacterium periodonticum]